MSGSYYRITIGGLIHTAILYLEKKPPEVAPALEVLRTAEIYHKGEGFITECLSRLLEEGLIEKGEKPT